MVMTDPVADFLTRIRMATWAHETVEIPFQDKAGHCRYEGRRVHQGL